MKRMGKRSNKSENSSLQEKSAENKKGKKSYSVGRKIKKSIALFLCVLFVFLPMTTSAYDGSKRIENGIWNVRTSSIVRELRLIGNLNRILIREFDERFFKFGNFLWITLWQASTLPPA